jgi:hypothetical protein
MAIAYKVLGQSAPSATTNTDIYTVAASTQVVISSIVVANRAASATTFRIAIRPNAATLANQHYIAFDTAIAANDVVALSLGITVDAADVVTVYGGNANLSFSLYGTEIT